MTVTCPTDGVTRPCSCLIADHGQPVCQATRDGWCCTRADGHPLPHVAWGGRVCDVWWITVHDRTETRRSDG